MKIEEIKKNRSFDGYTHYFKHESEVTKTEMKFSCYIPDGSDINHGVIWLSGLTCNEENFITKAGAQSILSGTNTMIICPDTSPRGLDLPGEHDSYDFGSGAGFYLNAETKGYKDHYNMYDYIKTEIVSILKESFRVKKISIMGHSMGGHGALILGLREKDLFSSVSAFSPIVNPTKCPWGKKAFSGYLGDHDASEWDATELVISGNVRNDCIFIDQGLADEFLEKELLTENFKSACSGKGQEVRIEYRDGYDHSYFYIATFIKEHLKFHMSK